MAQDFTPPRPEGRSMRPYTRSVNHIKTDQFGNVDIGIGDLGDVDGTPDNGDTIIYNSTTNIFEYGSSAGPSWIDRFTIADDATDTFLLTHTPIDGSWNVGMGWPWDEDHEFSLTGRALTVLNPASTFRGIAANGPRTLRVQYDYTAGVAAGSVAYVDSLTSLSTDANFDFVLPASVLPGDLMVAMWTANFSWPVDPSWDTWHYGEPGSTQALAAKFITTEGPGDPVYPSVGGARFRAAGVMGLIRGVDLLTPYHDVQFGGSPVAPTTDAIRYAMHFASGFNTSDPAPLSRGTQRNAAFSTPLGAVVADEVLAAGTYSVSSAGDTVAMASVVFNGAL